jgi:hypothetical protein
MTQVGERITCTGRVAAKFERDGERLLHLIVETANEGGADRTTGEAIVAVP